MKLTITVEKIDRVMDDVRAQIEDLQCDLIKLRLARERIVLLPVNEREQEGCGVGSHAHKSPSLPPIHVNIPSSN
ncbi:MAG: hypothetical protein HY038_12155 [Nitrospirae bacterium]|nr:hypothetical protein [Nitrospirota bacterium]